MTEIHCSRGNRGGEMLRSATAGAAKGAQNNASMEEERHGSGGHTEAVERRRYG